MIQGFGVSIFSFILCADVSSNFYFNSLQLRVSVFKYIDKCDKIINPPPQKNCFYSFWIEALFLRIIFGK